MENGLVKKLVQYMYAYHVLLNNVSVLRGLTSCGEEKRASLRMCMLRSLGEECVSQGMFGV